MLKNNPAARQKSKRGAKASPFSTGWGESGTATAQQCHPWKASAICWHRVLQQRLRSGASGNAQEGKTGISEVHKPFPRKNITCVGLIENTEGTEWFALELKRCNRNCDQLKAPFYYLSSYSWRPHLYLNSSEEVIDCWNPDVRPGFELCQGNSAATPRSIFSSGLYHSDGAS